MTKSDPLKHTAKLLLAAAASERFPGSTLWGGSVDPRGFCYDFSFPFSFQEAFLPLIEERMRAIVKQKRPIVLREMVPENAALFFAHRGQQGQQEQSAKREEAGAGLVSIVQMGEFYDLAAPMHFAPLAHTGELVAFALTAFKELGEGRVRIYGVAFASRDRLKEYLKRLKRYGREAHPALMREMRFFAPCSSPRGRPFFQWQPRGELLRDLLVRWWREEHLRQDVRMVSTPPLFSAEELIALHRPYGPRTAELVFLEECEEGDETLGLFAAGGYTRDLAHFFCGEAGLLQESISSLQFITKISRILGFDWQLVLCRVPRRASCRGAAKGGLPAGRAEALLRRAASASGYPLVEEEVGGEQPRLEIRVADALGCYWPGPELSVDCQSGVLVRSMLGAWERSVGLLLERDGGKLPFWLVPEQARLFAVGRDSIHAAEEQQKALLAKGFRVGVDLVHEEKLALRMHKALLEKVPYCIFIGDREREKGEVSVRVLGEESNQRVRIEALEEMWNRKQEERI